MVRTTRSIAVAIHCIVCNELRAHASKTRRKKVLYAARADQKFSPLTVAHDFDLSDGTHRLIIFQNALQPIRRWSFHYRRQSGASDLREISGWPGRTTQATVLCFRRLAIRDESRQGSGKNRGRTNFILSMDRQKKRNSLELRALRLSLLVI